LTLALQTEEPAAVLLNQTDAGAANDAAVDEKVLQMLESLRHKFPTEITLLDDPTQPRRTVETDPLVMEDQASALGRETPEYDEFDKTVTANMLVELGHDS
jgi:hypothetical protein